MTRDRVYLDHAASAPMDPAAREAMIGVLAAAPGNPASPHAEGRARKDDLEAARSRVADALGCRPREIVFTSGAVEAMQIALQGAARARRDTSRRLVVSAVEHPAILDTADALSRDGYEVVRVPVDDTGRVAGAQFLDLAGDDTAVAALMAVNHETGAVMPVAEVAGALGERGIPLLCDASLAPGRIPAAPRDLPADLVAYSGHRCGGPVGSGALYVRRGTRLAPWLHGGVQEERIRPGTENVAACAGLSVALHRACREQDERATRYDALIDRFLAALADLDDWSIVGPRSGRVPGLVTVELRGVEGEAAMINMDLEGIAVATGSTCALGSTDPSPGLVAMGMSRQRASSTLRISVGEHVTEEDTTRAASSLCRIVSRLRSLARR